MATDTPVLDFGFKSQSGQPYLHLAEAYMIYVPSDSLVVLETLKWFLLNAIPKQLNHTIQSKRKMLHFKLSVKLKEDKK